MKRTALIATLALAAVAATGCSSSPEDVCDHMVELLENELGAEAASKLDKKECVSSLERERDMIGEIEYRKQASCVMDAESFQAIRDCDKQ